MALFFFDGFESIDATQILEKWDFVRVGPLIHEATGGRRASGGVRLTSNTRQVIKDVPRLSTYIAGGACKPTTGQSGTAALILFMTNLITTIHIEIRGETDGNISIYRGSTQLDITTDNPLAFDDFNFIEARVVIDNSVGAVEVRLNGSTILNITSVDTRNGTSDMIEHIAFGGHSGGSGVTVDDCYMLDETGAAPQNTFLGDIRVDTLKPSADGGLSQLPTVFPASPATSFDKVDEVLADDDSTYIQSTALNQVSTFTYENLPVVLGGAEVYAVQVNTRVKKTESGDRALSSLQRFSSVNTAFLTHGVSTDNITHRSVHPTNPRTASPWLESEVDALEVGLEVL